MIFQPASACCRIPADHFAAMFPGAQATLISVRADVEQQPPRRNYGKGAIDDYTN
jgi:hypothetical protein